MAVSRAQHTAQTGTGFTLIELLVAIAVFAVMSVMAYGGLSNVIDNSTHATLELERLQAVQHAVFVVGRDLTQIVERDIRDEYGNNQSYIAAGNNPDYLLEFSRGGRRNPAKQLRSHLLRVAYRLEDEKLSRLFWPQLDRVQNMEPYESILLEDVSSTELRFLDTRGEWHAQWPPLSTPDSKLIDLSAIELSLSLKDWGEIKRLYRVTY